MIRLRRVGQRYGIEVDDIMEIVTYATITEAQTEITRRLMKARDDKIESDHVAALERKRRRSFRNSRIRGRRDFDTD